MSEKSMSQLSQVSTVEVTSTVNFSKLLPVIPFPAAPFLFVFLVSSLLVCDGEIIVGLYGRLFEQDSDQEYHDTAQRDNKHVDIY